MLRITRMSRFSLVIAVFFVFILEVRSQASAGLIEVLSFPDDQPTGIAICPNGRTFVNFPTWRKRPQNPVVEVKEDGRLAPYPDLHWNQAHDHAPRTSFVGVQSVYCDVKNHLWIVDTGKIGLTGKVNPEAAKLLEVDTLLDQVVEVFSFDATLAPADAYLNDVRVDTQRGIAYLTDSGLGAIIVLNLQSGNAWRRLTQHPSTHAEEGYTLYINNKAWRAYFGVTPKVHSDGLALDPSGDFLYFHALSGTGLYRIATSALRDQTLTEERLGAAVEKLGNTTAADGMDMDQAGNLYITAPEQNAILVRRPDGQIKTLIQDERLQWPDSIAISATGMLYVTASQIHLMPAFHWGFDRSQKPFRVFNFDLNPTSPRLDDTAQSQ